MSHDGQSNTGEPGAQTGASIPDAITPELVKQVADKVYAMLLEDLTIEKERRRLPNRRPFRG